MIMPADFFGQYRVSVSGFGFCHADTCSHHARKEDKILSPSPRQPSCVCRPGCHFVPGERERHRSQACRPAKRASIYFDYNATTPLDPLVRNAMLPFLDEIFGNPSSVHHVGRRARSLLDDARDRVASVFHSKPSEVYFTSGGTESNNLAVFGCARALRARGVTSSRPALNTPQSCTVSNISKRAKALRLPTCR